MAWLNYPDFRMGVLDRGTRLQPEIALRSCASASDVFIDTRGSIYRRPGFEDQGVQLEDEFVTVPYYTEEETYLFVISHGCHLFASSDAGAGNDSGESAHTGGGSGSQTWPTGTGSPLSSLTQFTGKMFLYKVDQTDAESGLVSVGFVTQQHWATAENDYLFGHAHTIRRGQGALVGGTDFAVVDLTHYLHPWTAEQCKGIQYAQHGSKLYLFIPGFPSIEIQKSDRKHSSIRAPYISTEAPHASRYQDSSTEYGHAWGKSGSTGGEAWDFAVDVLEPELARRASPPLNLLLTTATELVASDDFFTSEMEGGFISYGSAQINASDPTEPGDWLFGGVLLKIMNVHSTRVAQVAGVETPGSSGASGSGDLVAEAYTTGGDIYDYKSPGTDKALVAGDASTMTSSMLGDWAGPWVRTKGMIKETSATTLTGITVVPASLTEGVAGSPHHGWDSIAGYDSAERVTAGIGKPNGQFYYTCDTDSVMGVEFSTHLALDEKDVGSLVLVRQGTTNDWLFYLHNVTDTSGGYDFSGTLRYHLQLQTTANPATFARINSGAYAADITPTDGAELALFKVKSPYVAIGCTGWNSDPTTTAGQTYKATIHVNDSQFFPANLHTGNRPIKRGGVKRGYTTGTDGLPTTTVDENLEAPLMGGASVFFRNGVFRPTARVSSVCYEGYWESPPSTASPQGFVSFGSGGSSGFASCGVQHQGRLVVGGFSGAFEDALVFSTTNQPRRMMSPHIDSADDAFALQLGQTTEEQVNWMGSTQVGIVAGGRTGEYLVRGEPISAMKVAFQRISSVGGTNIRPTLTDSEIVFVCRGKGALGGVQIKEGADAATFSARLSDRASSLFTNSIVQSGYVYSPHPTFFFLMSNGSMLAFTRDQSVGGFTTLSHANGTIKSLSSAVRSAKLTDSLFCCVERTVNGSPVYRLERLNFATILDSQRCTTQYRVASYGGETDVDAIATNAEGLPTKLVWLNPWAGQTLDVVTVDSSGVSTYRGTQAVQSRTMTDGITLEYYISLVGMGLTEVPAKIITGFGFDGAFEPSSITPTPGYICSYTSGIMLGENITGLTINKGAVVKTNLNVPPESVGGWISVYNLGHFSRDAGPLFTLNGPFRSTIQSLSAQVESKE